MHPYRIAPPEPVRARPSWVLRAVVSTVILWIAWYFLVSVLSHVSAPWPQP